MTEQACICHIALTVDVLEFTHSGEYRCASLDSEGFIHCCDRQQLAGVVSRYYGEVDDVQLLIIDSTRLEAPLVRENTIGGDELFPHVYGPINSSCIVQVQPFGIDSTERRGLFN